MTALKRKFLLRQSMYEYLKEVNGLPKLDQPTDIKRVVKFVSSKRPRSNEFIDQCPITNQDLVERVSLIYKYLPSDKNKEILFVGDDDLASAIIGNTSHFSLTVVDIDGDILSTIKACIKGKQANLINTNILDIADEKIADPLNQKFDAFVTDPPYTEMGYKYFLNYGIKHLKMNGFAFVAVPYMNSEDWADELLFKVENHLLNSGLVILELIPGFAEYQHEEKVISTMIIAKKVTVSKQTSVDYKRKKVYTTGFEL